MPGYLLFWGFLIPKTNTTFIVLSIAAYLRNSFFPHLILRLSLLTFYKSYQINLLPSSNVVPLGKENSSGRNKPYLENSLSGANPVDYY
jgi:hypothetical protein